MDKWFRIGQGRLAHITAKYRDTVRLTVYAQGRGGVPAVVVLDRIFINPAQVCACLEEVAHV